MSEMPEEYQVTDQEIEAVWGNANFGARTNKRNVVIETLAQIAAGYSTGHTAQCICQELGLLGKVRWDRTICLTEKGRKFLYYSQKHLTNIATKKLPSAEERTEALEAFNYLMGIKFPVGDDMIETANYIHPDHAETIRKTLEQDHIREVTKKVARPAVSEAIKDLAELLTSVDVEGFRAKNISAPEDVEVKELCDRVGYGAVMDSAERQWFLKDGNGGNHTTGHSAMVIKSTLDKHRDVIEAAKGKDA